MPRFAAIDIGSNALRLRVVEATEAGQLREITSERAAVRLGQDVFLTGRLTATAIASAVDALRAFRDVMKAAGVDAYRAVATSAVREASNADVLVERIAREVGIKLEVIEGVEEARLVRVAVARAVRIGDRRALLVDIGGGSVELTWLAGEEPRASVSLPMGTVRLQEAFLGQDAITPERRALLMEYIERLLHEAYLLRGPKPDVVVATGGNAEALAQLSPVTTPDGPGFDVARTRALRDELEKIPPRERRERYNLRGDRADVIIPAMYVLGTIAESAAASTVVAPGVGLKDGILAELVDREFRVWDERGEEAAVEAQIVELGRRYRFDEAHAMHVAALASSLFDQLEPLHRFGREERALLRLAALAHDVGDFIGYESHHKHTYYIVANTDIMGLGGERRELVANVARYHRKAHPDLAHMGYRKLDRRGREVVGKLAGILRLADAFDREHLGKVRELVARVDRARVSLRAKGEGDLSLEIWTAARKADLLEKVFERKVVVEGAERL